MDTASLPEVGEEEELWVEDPSLVVSRQGQQTVQVVMIKNVKEGSWKQSKEWGSPQRERPTARRPQQPAFHTPRLNRRRVMTATATNDMGQLQPLWSVLRSSPPSARRPEPHDLTLARRLVGTFGTADRRLQILTPRAPAPRSQVKKATSYCHACLSETLTTRIGSIFSRTLSSAGGNFSSMRRKRPVSDSTKRLKNQIEEFENRLATYYGDVLQSLPPPSRESARQPGSPMHVPGPELEKSGSFFFGSMCFTKDSSDEENDGVAREGKPSIWKALKDKPSRSRVAPALVSLLCNMPAEVVANKYYQFCQKHAPEALLQVTVAIDVPQQEDVEKSLVGPQNASQQDREMYQQLDAGNLFFVHPDGMTFPQFFRFLETLLMDTSAPLSEQLARTIFACVPRDNMHRIQFADFLQAYTSSLVPQKVQENVNFFLSCFDPYQAGRLPNHMFNSRFLRRFVDDNVPGSVLPQWRLLLDAIQRLESSLPSLFSTSRSVSRQELWRWLNDVFLKPHICYRIFVERCAALAMKVAGCTARDAIKMKLLNPQKQAVLSSGSTSTNTAAIGTRQVTELAELQKKNVTVAISYEEARVLIYGNVELRDLFYNNNFIFHSTQARQPPVPHLLPATRAIVV